MVSKGPSTDDQWGWPGVLGWHRVTMARATGSLWVPGRREAAWPGPTGLCGLGCPLSPLSSPVAGCYGATAQVGTRVTQCQPEGCISIPSCGICDPG